MKCVVENIKIDRDYNSRLNVVYNKPSDNNMRKMNSDNTSHGKVS